VRGNTTLFGLYEGVPTTKRGSSYSMVLPDKITIFKMPIERYFGDDPEKMHDHVRDVVLHEIGHYFGLSDKEIRRAGK
jgi:predicted Zn-dependent protease with MMP-like domain